MRVLIGALLLANLAQSKIVMSTDVLIDIGENRDRIVEIFDKVPTLSVLLKDFEPDGLVELLKDIFGVESKTLAIFGFSKVDYYKDWTKHCKMFQNDSTTRFLYYERYYQKTHEVTNTKKRKLDFFEDFEPHVPLTTDDSIDPQSPLASTPVRLPESFAIGLDRWFAFRESGYVLLVRLDALELYLGCLLNRAGTFLFIVATGVDDEHHLDAISMSLRKAWRFSANLRIFILISREIYVLNPFVIDKHSGSFGMLEKLSDTNVARKLENLNAHPMSVEIFSSAYSIPNGTRFTGRLDSFIGPDVQVAQFIQQQMNVTSN